MNALVKSWSVEPHVLFVEVRLNLPKKKAETLPPPGTPLDVSIGAHREKRSRNANAYCWALCQAIAEKIGATQVEVYREAVKQAGPRDELRIRKEAVPSFTRHWAARGIGWQVEVVDQNGPWAYVLAFPGSSTYDTAEMSRLLDCLIEEAEAAGVDVITPSERARMLAAWER